jgi:hypothetical protein
VEGGVREGAGSGGRQLRAESRSRARVLRLTGGPPQHATPPPPQEEDDKKKTDTKADSKDDEEDDYEDDEVGGLGSIRG